MWIIENYLKYFIGMAILWAVIWAQRNLACTSMTTDQMVPLMKKEDYFMYYPRQRSTNEFRRNTDLVYFTQRARGINRNEEYVARVVGLPGDRVKIENGTVIVNGEPQPDNYVKEELKYREEMPEILVPREHLFVLSDSRRVLGYDSRSFGPISRHSIQGRVRPPQ